MGVDVTGPDGKDYSFPDGTTKEKAVAYFKKKGIGLTAGQKYQAKKSSLPKKEVFSFTQNPQEAMSQAATELGEQSSELMDVAQNPDAYKGGKMIGPRSGLNRAGAAMLSGVAGGGEVAAKLASGLMDWKTAAGFLLSKVSPAAGAAFFATQGAKGAYDALNRGDTSPENVQNFLLSLAGVSGAMAGGASSGDTGITADKIRESLPAPKRALGKLVADTRAGNVADAESVAKDNAATKQRSSAELAKYNDKVKSVEEHNRAELAKHQQEVDSAARENLKSHVKHLSEKADIEQSAASSKAAQEARAALQQSIDKDSELLDVKTEKARHDALVEGNNKYSAVNEQLSGEVGDPEQLRGSLIESLGKIRGTEIEPPILKSVSSRLQEGDQISYSDLQGYYSELGRELSKGTLPGDIYAAYDSLHDAIGEQMQEIADRNGQGIELNEARSYWKRMKRTFGKSSDTAGDRAGKLVGDEAPETVEAQQREYRKRLLGSFDPEIPTIVDRVAQSRSQLKALPAQSAKPAEVPPPPEAIEVGSPRLKKAPDPPPDRPLRQPAPKSVGKVEVEAAKRQHLQGTADWIRNRGAWAASWPALYVLRDVLRGQGFPIGEAAVEAGGTLAATHAVAHALENPAVVKFLTKATAKDIAAIPADLRGDFPGMIKKAQQQGVKISPVLTAVFSGAANKPPAPRRHPSDVYSDPAQLSQ
jgi:hypothetical protein